MRAGRVAGAALACAVAVLAARAASAHVVLDAREATAGGYFKAVFRVPHGCEGAATTGITVRLPPGVVVAKPQPKPGWVLRIEREELAQPVTNEGHTLTQRVSAVAWEGGTLADDSFDEFAIMLRLPATPGPLAFPVVQQCGDVSVSWTAQSGTPHPAPTLLLKAR